VGRGATKGGRRGGGEAMGSLRVGSWDFARAALTPCPSPSEGRGGERGRSRGGGAGAAPAGVGVRCGATGEGHGVTGVCGRGRDALPRGV
jgi:hypothetical protein